MATACRRTLQDISASRVGILRDLAQAHRKRDLLGFPMPRRSLSAALRQLSEPEREIADLHLAGEEASVKSLRSLAQTVAADDPDFRVTVTTTDFSLIQERYHDNRIDDVPIDRVLDC